MDKTLLYIVGLWNILLFSFLTGVLFQHHICEETLATNETWQLSFVAVVVLVVVGKHPDGCFHKTVSMEAMDAVRVVGPCYRLPSLVVLEANYTGGTDCSW